MTSDDMVGANQIFSGKDKDQRPGERRPDGNRGRNEGPDGGASRDTSHPEDDPVEASRATVEHELDRQDQSSSDQDDAKRARQDLPKQVKEEAELPQRGSA